MSGETLMSSVINKGQKLISKAREVVGYPAPDSIRDEYLNFADLLNNNQPYQDLNKLNDPESVALDMSDPILERMQGSLVGLAIGDALGASVEFRPNSYLKSHPVEDMQGGGTWGLKPGQWTDDTSMALCLAASLIVKGGFDGYDQMCRYKRWFRTGYLSSTGECFDIGKSTRESILNFEQWQQQAAEKISKECRKPVDKDAIDQYVANHADKIKSVEQFGSESAAGNGALMRLAPIPLFYFNSESKAIKNATRSAKLTHGDPRAIDACRFYAVLIQRALTATSKKKLLEPKSYENCFNPPLHPEITGVIEGSYIDKDGYEGKIRGKGFVVKSLEAALWAFWSDENSFKTGVLLAVNLGDDADTTAAIYGQLAGAFYGIQKIPEKWREQLFEREFIIKMANGLYMKGRKTAAPTQQRNATASSGPTDRSASNNSPTANDLRPKSAGLIQENWGRSMLRMDVRLQSYPSAKNKMHTSFTHRLGL